MSPSRRQERHLTIEEYGRLDESDHVRSELVRGRLVSEPRPAAPHGRVQALLARHLDLFVEENGLGRVLTDVGVVIDRAADTVQGPDVLFVSDERLGGPLPDGFLEVAPDLAVEIVSPSNSASDMQRKVLEYLTPAAARWVVDPASLRSAPTRCLPPRER